MIERMHLQMREARPADAMAVAKLHVRSWRAAYRGLLPEDFLDALRPEERASRYTFGSPDPGAPRTILAFLDGELAGFATVSRSRDEDVPQAGELCALYVDPDHWRDGVGRRLLAESRRLMREEGYEEAILWVLVGNETAERFYEADGWRRDGSERTEDPWGVVSQVIRYRRRLDEDGPRESA
jgi:GNAT superfamily N-acetyltransferase